VPFWVALALGKLEDLQMVAVGVLEVESLDAAGVRLGVERR
jgi:hypothetical protein